MSKPTIADRKPAVVELEPKTHYWCSCGLSAGQPFCDGSHVKSDGFEPLAFEVTETKRAALCQCKHTKNAPYCDGTHAKLD